MTIAGAEIVTNANPRNNGPNNSHRPREAESQVRALHRATLSLFSDLSLDGVLHRIVAAAKELTDARYAALAIPDGKGGLKAFVTSGLSEEEISRIPHPPVGDGLIGEMLRTGQAIRVPEITEHPKSVGFPPGHPVMHSFLGTPIAAYGRPLGQIYLTDKQGAPEFTEEDQRLTDMLAAHAAAAIENAGLYQRILEAQGELAQRNEELELINSLTNAVSSAMELEALMEEMLRRVILLSGAGAGEIFLRQEDFRTFRLAKHVGEAPEAFWETDQFELGQGLIGLVAEAGKPQWTMNLADEPRFLRPAVAEAGFGTLVAVPLMARGQVVGVLNLAFRGQREISNREIGLLRAVGAGVGIGVETARLTRQARRLAVLEERDRIGMDLHDGIIQSIYAVGLSVESVRLMLETAPETVRDHLDQAISGLNDIISDIRAYILDLRPSRMPADDLGRALEVLATEFRTNTSTELLVVVEAEAMAELEVGVAEELFHIAQEALANVAKHAQAGRAWLSVRNVDSEVLLQVIDDGRGFDAEGERRMLGHGLSNMARRASLIGGSYDMISAPGEGTTVTVRIRTDKKGAEMRDR